MFMVKLYVNIHGKTTLFHVKHTVPYWAQKPNKTLKVLLARELLVRGKACSGNSCISRNL